MDTTTKPPTIDDGEVVIEGMGTLSRIDRAEIDIQIATAHRYPRQIVRFQKEAREMALVDEETARAMFYVLERKDKFGGVKRIEGPGVRLAEICAGAWTNLRCAARAFDVGPADKVVVAQGVCFDLEKNYAIAVEIRRRITDREGRRYSDDMVAVTANAAASIAFRQAVFKVIPMAYIKAIYEDAKEIAIGKALSREQRVARAVEAYGKVGVKPDQLLIYLTRKALEDITTDDLVKLSGLWTAIQDGDTTLAEAFGEKPTPAAPATGDSGPKSGLDKLADTLGPNPAPAAAPTPPPAAGPSTPGPTASASLPPKGTAPADSPGSAAPPQGQGESGMVYCTISTCRKLVPDLEKHYAEAHPRGGSTARGFKCPTRGCNAVKGSQAEMDGHIQRHHPRAGARKTTPAHDPFAVLNTEAPPQGGGPLLPGESGPAPDPAAQLTAEYEAAMAAIAGATATETLDALRKRDFGKGGLAERLEIERRKLLASALMDKSFELRA